MPASRRPRPHRLVPLGLAALLALLGSVAVATPAAAHDSLISSDPAADSSVEAMPEEITLSFSAALLTMSPQDTIVDVVAPSGADVSEGDAVVDGAVVRQAIGTVTEAGAYTVNWHVVSSDGHPTEGTFAFTVETASGGSGGVAPENDATATPPPPKDVVTPTPVAPTATPSDTPSATASAPAEDDEDRSFGEMLPWILLILTGVAVLGALIAVLVARVRGGKDGASRETSDQD
ncbi:copper resistance CopC family protein [Microbacterium sp. JZ31]|uniref:copper resistance CopC family protein n=1 Tax=Microbacterium sp. JZ31 TaxID=1906274 RepID=UPI0019322F99|nr:copper resistance protein CopC [Microbacterium sp. JZ31]